MFLIALQTLNGKIFMILLAGIAEAEETDGILICRVLALIE